MKSKTSLTSFAWENVKKQLWIPSMIFIALLLTMVVPMLIQIQSWGGNNSITLLEERQNIFRAQFLSQSDFTDAVTLLCALVSGIAGFSYLHSKSKSDFLFALPIRRERLHLMQFFAGLLYYIIPLTVMLGLALFIGGVNNLLNQTVLMGLCGCFLFQLLIYLFTYLYTILAMQLTGRTFVGVLLVVTFITYGGILSYVLTDYYQTFFMTYVKGEWFFEALLYTNPVGFIYNKYNYLRVPAGSLTYQAGKTMLMVLITIAIIVAAFFFSLYLSKKRPAEAAGRSLTFRKTENLLQVAVTLLGGLSIGIMAYQMGYSAPVLWGVLGIIFGTLLVNGMVSVIYRMDFRCFFTKKIQIPVLTIVVLLVFFIFRFDLTGYDRYLPKQNQVKSVAILLDTFAADMNYENTTTSIKARGKFKYFRTYYENDMEVPCEEPLYEFLKCVVKDSVKQFGEVGEVTVADQTGGEYVPYVSNITLSVRYQLKNGLTKTRQYLVNPFNVKEQFEKVMDLEAYRTSMYPVLNISVDDINAYQLESQAVGMNEKSLTKEGREFLSRDGVDAKELLEYYKKDLFELSGKAFTEEVPIGTLNFYNYIPGFEQDYFYTSGYSPIYPSFKRTIKWFKEKGVDLENFYPATEVKRLVISDYREQVEEDVDMYPDKANGYENFEHIFDKQDEIDKLIPYLGVNDWRTPFSTQVNEASVMVEKRYNQYAAETWDYYVRSPEIYRVMEELEQNRVEEPNLEKE